MMASTSAASRQEFSQVFYDQLKCFNCSSSLKAGKHRWYKCFAFHLVCQDCKEVKGYKKCSCTKPIEEFKDENVESGVCDDVDE